MKDMKHSTSNGCPSFHHGIQFPVLRGTPNLVLFCLQFEKQHWQKRHGVNHKRLVDAVVRSSSHLAHGSKEGYEPPELQWISLIAAKVSHFMYQKSTPNLASFLGFESQLGKNSKVWTIAGVIDAVKNSYHLPYLSMDGHEALQQQRMPHLVVHHPTLYVERVPTI